MYGLLGLSFLPFVIATPALQTRNIWELPSHDNYNLIGCYADSSTWPDLSYTAWQNSATDSAETCIDACQAAGYSYAGLENGSECYCGNDFDGSTLTNCSTLCTGNAGEICGGSSAATVYRRADVVQCYDGYQLVNCFAENNWRYPGTDRRLLRYQQSIPADGLTVETCIEVCKGAGYNAAGVENGQECWCDALPDLSDWALASTYNCSMACTGNNGEACGGGIGEGTIIVYNDALSACPSSGWGTTTAIATGVSSTSASGVTTTATATATVIVTAAATTTVTTTTTTTKTATTTVTATATTTVGSTGTGAGSNNCGGTTTATGTITETSITTVTATAIITDSSGTGAGAGPGSTVGNPTTKTVTATPTTTAGGNGGWTLKGCYLDILLLLDQVLDILGLGSVPLTVDACQIACHSAGYNVCGISGGTTCYCGLIGTLDGVLSGLLPGVCNAKCPGNSAEVCGGYGSCSVWYHE